MTPPMTIRPFRPAPDEYRAVIYIWNVAWPNLAGFQDRMQQEDENRDPRFPLLRWVVEAGQDLAAYGDVRKLENKDQPGAWYLSLQVLPAWRRRGIGGALYDTLIGLLPAPDAQMLFTDTFDTFEDSDRFLQARGFSVFMRYPISVLDLAAFDPARFAPVAEQVNKRGVRILPLSELSCQEPHWEEKLWLLDVQVNQDAPAPVAPRPMSFEEFQQRKIRAAWFRPDLWLVALDGEHWVGESSLEPVAPGRFWTHITGVLKSHRRQGIATALKLSIIAQARSLGGVSIQTSNEENNPMYRINQALGFQPEPTEVHYRKTLR